MPQKVPLEDAAQTLSSLEAGQRAWFCPTLPVNVPRLLLRAFDTDPSAAGLHRAVAGLDVSRDAQTCTGIVVVGEDGCLTLGSRGVTRKMLPALAQWTLANIAHHPGLARLRGALRQDRS